jgi:hypothetical protein
MNEEYTRIYNSLKSRNVLTRLGELDTSSSGDTLEVTIIDNFEEIENYSLNTIIKRLCTAVSEELQDSVICIESKNDIYKYITQNKIQSFLDIALESHIQENVYGGSLIVTTRLDEKLPADEYISVDASRAIPINLINYDEYRIFTGLDVNLSVTKHNFYKLKGRYLTDRQRQINRGWGRSLIEEVIQSVTQYSGNNSAITTLLRRLNTMVYGISQMGAIMATEKLSGDLLNNLDEVFKILELFNILIVDKDAVSAAYANRSLGGIGELIEQARVDLELIAMSTISMPSILLWGKAGRSGLSDKGSSELDIWYKSCNNVLQNKILPVVRWMIINYLPYKDRSKFDDLIVSSTQLQEYQQIESAIKEKTLEENKKIKQDRLLVLLEKGLIDEKYFKRAMGLDMNQNSVSNKRISNKKTPIEVLDNDILTEDEEGINDDDIDNALNWTL